MLDFIGLATLMLFESARSEAHEPLAFRRDDLRTAIRRPVHCINKEKGTALMEKMR